MSTIWALDSIKNKYSLCFVENCMKWFCISLREHATDVTNFEKKTKQNVNVDRKRTKIVPRCKQCYICRKRFTQR